MTRKILVVVLLSVCATVGRAQEKPQYYVIQARADVGYSVKLNDIPICRFDEGGYFFSEVNSQLLPGRNDIFVEILWPQTSAPADEPSLEVKLYLVDMESELQEEAKRYASFALPQPTDRSKPLVLKQSFTIPFVEDLLLARAEPVGELTAEDKQAMVAQVEELKRAFLDKDADKLYALQRYSLEDLARARYKAFDFAKWKEGVANGLFSGIFTMIETPDAPKFEPMGRLVRVSSFDDGPDATAIKMEVEYDGERHMWSLPLYFAKVDGAWIILR